MSRWPCTRYRRCAAGFTLIEVLVALSIVSITLLAGQQAASSLLRLSDRQQQQWLAQLCAENALAALRLQRQWPPLGTRRQDCEQAGQSYTVLLEVTSTPNPAFRSVQARVLQGNGEETSLLQLATLIGRY